MNLFLYMFLGIIFSIWNKSLLFLNRIFVLLKFSNFAKLSMRYYTINLEYLRLRVNKILFGEFLFI